MRSSRRLTILGLNYAPEPTGNAPYTTALARHRAADGDDVTVVAGHPHYPQWRRYDGFGGWRRETSDAGVRLIRVLHWVPRPPRGIRRLVSELTFGARQAVTRWNKPDVVVLVSPALFASAMCMTRLVFTRGPLRVVWVQDLYSQGLEETAAGGALARRVTRGVEGWTLRRAHVVVAIHPAMAQLMTAKFGIDARRIRVIPNWSHVTPSSLSRDAAREHLGWDVNQFVVLHAGNMGAKQGLINVVEAARLADKHAAHVQFVLLGDGAERGALEASAAGIHSLTFLDPVSDSDFPIALAAADVLLVNELPGVKEMAVPSKLTSYFAAGRPVIAAGDADGVVAGIVAKAHAGVSVRSGDPNALLTAAVALQRAPRGSEGSAQSAADYWLRHMSANAALAEWDTALEATTLISDTKGDHS